MSINKQHTGAFARSKYGFPNFSESPKYARGSVNFEVVWSIDVFTVQVSKTASAIIFMNGTTGVDYVDKFSPSVKSRDPNFSEASIYLWGLLGGFTFAQYGTQITAKTSYLPGKYRIRMICPVSYYNAVKTQRESYGRDYTDQKYYLVADGSGTQKLVSPADFGVGWVAPYPTGVTPIGYFTGVDGNGNALYVADANIDTRIVFGATVTFKPQSLGWVKSGAVDPMNTFSGQSLPP